MTAKSTFIAAISALLLSIGGVVVLNEVQAQQVCGRTGDPACASGLACVSNRCNLPPPIWDARVSGTAQNAGIFLRGIDPSTSLRVGRLQFGIGDLGNRLNSSGNCGIDLAPVNCEIALNFSPVGSPPVGRGFAVYNGQATPWFQVHRDGFTRISQGLSVGAASDTPASGAGEIRATRGTFSDAVSVGGLAVLTGIEASATSGLTVSVDGRTRTIRLGPTQDCASGNILRRSDGAWVCSNELSTLLGSAIRQPATCGADRYLQWDGSAWQCATVAAGAGGGVTDHGALAGLTDNDHPQYYLQTGDTRDLTVGRNLTATGALSAASISTAAGGSVETTTLTAANATVGGNPVLTALTVGPAGGLSITGTGNSRLVSLQTTCSAGQVLEWNAGATPPQWQCATIEAAEETEPAFTAWRGAAVGNQTLENLTVNSVLTVGTGAPELPRAERGVRVGGDVTASGCFGSTVLGATGATHDGNLERGDGYREVDALCNAALAGSHQCTTDEVMGSIHCGAIWSDANRTTVRAGIPQDQFVWISNGAPSLPTPTNDCYGWTQTGVIGDEQSQGVAWYFDERGGAGYARACNESYRVLCCR